MIPTRAVRQHPWLAAVALFLASSLVLGAGSWTHLQSAYRDKIHQLKTEAKFRIGFVEYALLDS